MVNSEKAYNTLRTALPIMGILVGLLKIFGFSMEVELFRAFGVPESFRIFFGAVQAGGAAMLYFPQTAREGIAVCISTLIFASSLMAFYGIWHILPVPLFGMALLAYYAKLFNERACIN